MNANGPLGDLMFLVFFAGNGKTCYTGSEIEAAEITFIVENTNNTLLKLYLISY